MSNYITDYRLAHTITKRLGLKDLGEYSNTDNTMPIFREYGAKIEGPHYKSLLKQSVFRTISHILEEGFNLDSYKILNENERKHNIGIYWRVKPEFACDGNSSTVYFRLALVNLD